MNYIILFFCSAYAMAFYGSLAYNYLLFQIAKDKCDDLEKDFEYRKYLKMNWDNWISTTILAPVLVWYMPDIIALINSKLGWELVVYKVYYLGAGPFTELVLFLLFKLIGRKKTLVAPVHND